MIYFVTLIILVLLAAHVINTSRSKPTTESRGWIRILSAAELITNNSTSVSDAIRFAQSDTDIGRKNSKFCKEAMNEFGDRFIDWITDDLDQLKVPAAVFKTILHGYGYMGYLDWKDISDSNETLLTLNNVLESTNLQTIAEGELLALKEQIDKITEPGEKANKLVFEMEKYVERSGNKIAWFDENGDSYAFFVVPADVAEKLVKIELDEDHQFVSWTPF